MYFKIFIIVISFVLLCVLCIFAMSLGAFEISYAEIWDFFWAMHSHEQHSVWQLILSERALRVFAALCVGGALALSGGLYQGIIGNALVSPSILGVLSGASFGAALGMLFGFGIVGIEILCFCFGVIAMGVSVLLAWFFDRRTSILMLILGGMISSAFFGAALSIIKLIADPYNTLPNIVFWLMGSLAHLYDGTLYVLAITLLFSCIVGFLYARNIDILSLDEESAQSMGVNVKVIRLCFILIATLLASACVAVAGIVGWVGLVIPHMARFIVGASHRFMLPFCTIFGSIFLLLCDTLARSLLYTEIPLGIVSAVIGIPIFVLLLTLRARKYG